MSKKILRIEYDFDFSVIGISSQLKDYRLCWFINHALELEFSRQDDLDLLLENGSTSYFSCYHHTFENLETEFYLVSNKGTAGLFIPENKETDFILMANQRLSHAEEKKLVQLLNRLPDVQAAYLIDAETLKSKENLLFM